MRGLPEAEVKGEPFRVGGTTLPGGAQTLPPLMIQGEGGGSPSFHHGNRQRPLLSTALLGGPLSGVAALGEEAGGANATHGSFRAAMRAGGAIMQFSTAEFDALDTNGDGVLNRHEAAMGNMYSATFKARDDNQDGVLTREEATGAMSLDQAAAVVQFTWNMNERIRKKMRTRRIVARKTKELFLYAIFLVVYYVGVLSPNLKEDLFWFQEDLRGQFSTVELLPQHSPTWGKAYVYFYPPYIRMFVCGVDRCGCCVGKLTCTHSSMRLAHCPYPPRAPPCSLSPRPSPTSYCSLFSRSSLAKCSSFQTGTTTSPRCRSSTSGCRAPFSARRMALEPSAATPRTPSNCPATFSVTGGSLVVSAAQLTSLLEYH
jgi:hypothetical protein